jgi:hypothetical protein
MGKSIVNSFRFFIYDKSGTPSKFLKQKESFSRLKNPETKDNLGLEAASNSSSTT